MIKNNVSGAIFEKRVRDAVAECVQMQIRAGIDIVADGEQGKKGFYLYVAERLEGFEARPGMKRKFFPAETAAFPEYYAQYFGQAMLGRTAAPVVPLVCTGPIRYRGEKALQRDLENLRLAAKGRAAFMPAIAPSGVGSNEYYKSEEEYFHAVGAALRTEYQAIVDAGSCCRWTIPFCRSCCRPRLRREGAAQARGDVRRGGERKPARHSRGESALPYLLRNQRGAAYPRGRAEGRGALHVARQREPVQLRGRQSAPRARVPPVGDGQARRRQEADSRRDRACQQHRRAPGVDRQPALCQLVGRDSIAGADCGFSSQATYNPEVHPTVVWAKFEAMRDGARLASAKLWKKRRTAR
jgi:5-methyltetrahydropteroyltriglutamate--homocysteine methyltransferase